MIINKWNEIRVDSFSEWEDEIPSISKKMWFPFQAKGCDALSEWEDENELVFDLISIYDVSLSMSIQ